MCCEPMRSVAAAGLLPFAASAPAFRRALLGSSIAVIRPGIAHMLSAIGPGRARGQSSISLCSRSRSASSASLFGAVTSIV